MQHIYRTLGTNLRGPSVVRLRLSRKQQGKDDHHSDLRIIHFSSPLRSNEFLWRRNASPLFHLLTFPHFPIRGLARFGLHIVSTSRDHHQFRTSVVLWDHSNSPFGYLEKNVPRLDLGASISILLSPYSSLFPLTPVKRYPPTNRRKNNNNNNNNQNSQLTRTTNHSCVL